MIRTTESSGVILSATRSGARDKLFIQGIVFGVMFGLPGALAKTADKSVAEKHRPTVLEVFAGQAAEKAGIKSGDKIICAADQMINRAEEFIRQVHLYKNTDCKIILKRGSETITKTITPNAEGRIGVRISDMNEAMVSKSETKGAVTCKRLPMLHQMVNPSGNLMLTASLKPGAAVEVLYEEPVIVKSTGKPVAISKIRLEADTEGTAHEEFEKGDWFTFSKYLVPKRIPPGPTTKNNIVTFEQSESLKAGMTLAAVRGLLGSSGNLLSRDRSTNGVIGQTIVWQNPDGTNLCCNFENDRLVYKSAFLLK